MFNEFLFLAIYRILLTILCSYMINTCLVKWCVIWHFSISRAQHSLLTVLQNGNKHTLVLLSKACSCKKNTSKLGGKFMVASQPFNENSREIYSEIGIHFFVWIFENKYSKLEKIQDFSTSGLENMETS